MVKVRDAVCCTPELNWVIALMILDLSAAQSEACGWNVMETFSTLSNWQLLLSYIEKHKYLVTVSFFKDIYKLKVLLTISELCYRAKVLG